MYIHEGGINLDKQRVFTVEKEGLLLPFLLEKHPQKGRNKVKAMLTRGQVMVGNSVITKHNHALVPGDRITILNVGSLENKAIGIGVAILYEDEHIIVIDKPPGLLSVATEDEKERTAFRIVNEHVQSQHPKQRIFIVHRLDRETSGLMMFARSEAIKHQLQDNWKDVVLERAYIALVEGAVENGNGTIKTWLKESNTKTMYVSRPGEGVPAITHYEVLRKNSEFSLLAVHLDTGRKNQIRAHLQSIGHSVVGDRRYGSRNNPIGRLGLHANKLSFRHPVTGEMLRFETAIPAKFNAVFAVQ